MNHSNKYAYTAALLSKILNKIRAHENTSSKLDAVEILKYFITKEKDRQILFDYMHKARALKSKKTKINEQFSPDKKTNDK